MEQRPRVLGPRELGSGDASLHAARRSQTALARWMRRSTCALAEWARRKTDTLRPSIVRLLDGNFLGYGTAPRVGTLVVTQNTMDLNLPSYFYFRVYWPSVVAVSLMISPHIEEACERPSV